MMCVMDESGVVHVAASKPAYESGRMLAGETRCHRWWAWATTNVADRRVVLMDYATSATPTCLLCANERRVC